MACEERSAGVVLFRTAPSAAEPRTYLLLDYGRHWDYPKGHVEEGEDDPSAALREVAEETGIAAVSLIPGFRHEIEYFFQSRKKGLVRKAVVFFLAEISASAEEIRLSDEHVGFAFLTYAAAYERLTYANAREVLRAAEAFLNAAAK